MAPKGKSKPRVSLSREIILDAAFRIVDADGGQDVTMSKLGAELGADPSAVYRHFRNKDELLLAMADVMLEEAITDYEPTGEPIEDLRRMAWGLRRSYLRRPGLARFVYYRFTGGEAEAQSVRTMLGCMRVLGYDEAEAIARTRGLAEMTLGHISMTADSLSLPRKAQGYELAMGTAYYTYDVARAPKRTDVELREAQLADGEMVFTAMLETFLAGLESQSPHSPALDV